MSLGTAPVRPAGQASRILVVDDDRRVRDLLEIALSAHGFEVVTAADGDEALERATRERPDLVVLDVRLPRRSGLEVCEQLRRDAMALGVPIILVSAAGETETRLQAFARGADDYLAKPFSPKELVARIKRLLARSAEGREALRRSRELERELGRAQDELRRAHAEGRRASRLRELALGIGVELQRVHDLDRLAQRLLLAVMTRTGVGVAGLLAPATPHGPLEALAVRGDALDRVAPLRVRRDGELARFLVGLARPVTVRELQRLRELRPALPPFVSLGFVRMAPIRGPGGLDGLIVTDERLDGTPPSPADLEVLQTLCEMASGALMGACTVRAVLDARLASLARARGAPGGAADEAARVLERAARALVLSPRTRAVARWAMRLVAAGPDEAARAALEAAADDDPTGYAREVLELVERASGPAPGTAGPEQADAIALVAALAAYARERSAGNDPRSALGVALETLDPESHAAVAAAVEASAREPDALGTPG